MKAKKGVTMKRGRPRVKKRQTKEGAKEAAEERGKPG